MRVLPRVPVCKQSVFRFWGRAIAPTKELTATRRRGTTEFTPSGAGASGGFGGGGGGFVGEGDDGNGGDGDGASGGEGGGFGGPMNQNVKMSKGGGGDGGDGVCARAVSGAESLSDPTCGVGCEVVEASIPRGGSRSHSVTNSQGQ